MHRACCLLGLLAVACPAPGDDTGGGDDTGTAPIDTEPPYDLRWRPGTSFGAAHGNQSYAMAVVQDDDVVDLATGAVPSTTDWEVTFEDVLEEGQTYDLHLWIDANINGGSFGTCDGAPDFHDHQWAWPTGEITGNLTMVEDHDTDFTDVCSTFL